MSSNDTGTENDLALSLETIEKNMKLEVTEKENIVQKRIGIAKGQDLYDDGYDLDELNSEIAEMFGVRRDPFQPKSKEEVLERLDESKRQADNGMGKNADVYIAELRKRYGL